MADETDTRTRTLDALVGELHRIQHIIECLHKDRANVSMADFTKVLEPLLAHNIEVLKLMTALSLDSPFAGGNRLTKVLNGD